VTAAMATTSATCHHHKEARKTGTSNSNKKWVDE